MNDKLFYIKNKEVQRIIELFRNQKNDVPCFGLVWHESCKCYNIWLNNRAKEEFATTQYTINGRQVINVGTLSQLKQGDFIQRRANLNPGETAPTQVFLNLRDNRYCLIDKIKETGSKRIYLGIDTVLHHLLVVLKLRQEGNINYDRFLRSSKILKQISSYIPALIDEGEIFIDGIKYAYQTFNYFNGTPLVNQETFPLEKAIKVFHQVATAIRDLHRAGIVHRNLAPEHILIGKDDNVKVVGLSLLKNVLGDLGTSGIIPIERGIELSFPNEIIGCLSWSPFNLGDRERDIYSIVSIFVYSILSQERQRTFSQVIRPIHPILTREMLYREYLNILDFPEALKMAIEEILVDQNIGNASALVNKFESTHPYIVAEITEADQYPMPKEEIQIPEAEIFVWYEPLDVVGGDFYDFIHIEEGKYGILIGDTGGHGIKACLYTHLICPIPLVLADQQIDPAKILQKMNLLLYKIRKSQGGKILTTALYGILHLGKHSNPYFHYASAGQPCPLLFRDREITQIKLAGTKFLGNSLGFDKSIAIMENSVTLRKNDILFFYTDGITETKDAAEEEYGDERLTARIKTLADNGKQASLKSLIDQLRQDIRAFRNQKGTHNPEDDITLIAVKIR